MRNEVAYLLEHGLAKPSCSPWSSPCLLVPVRVTAPPGFVLTIEKSMRLPSPTVFLCRAWRIAVDNLGSARYVSKLDLLKGYWQVPLTSRASDISAFVTPDSFYSTLLWRWDAQCARHLPATYQYCTFRGSETVTLIWMISHVFY